MIAIANAGRRRDGVGLDAVPVLHPQGAASRSSACRRREDPRHPDGDRRRLRRQGRISVDDRRARGAARLEIRPAGEDDLRSRRGHGGHHQAASFAHAASHGGDPRRQTARHGDRVRHRRRRLRDAFGGGAVARHDSRRRAVQLPQRAHPQPAPWPPTLRRTARSAASARRKASSRWSGTWIRVARGGGSHAGRIPPPQLHHARARPRPPVR